MCLRSEIIIPWPLLLSHGITAELSPTEWKRPGFQGKLFSLGASPVMFLWTLWSVTWRMNFATWTWEISLQQVALSSDILYFAGLSYKHLGQGGSLCARPVHRVCDQQVKWWIVWTLVVQRTEKIIQNQHGIVWTIILGIIEEKFILWTRQFWLVGALRTP